MRERFDRKRNQGGREVVSFVRKAQKLKKDDGRSRRVGGDTPLMPGFFELFRMPDGSAMVRPKELVDELSVTQACAVLRVSRSTVNWLCDVGRLQWRWATPLQGKRLIKAGSLYAYREARAARDE